MATLPKIPFTDMDDARVAVDAPVSTDLMTDLAVNEHYLKAVVTDGATAPQDITAKNITATGTLASTGLATLDSLDVTNNAHVFGNLIVDGTFTFDTATYLLAGFVSKT